eukprot:scaffold3525_cov128-Cylindrotheca_fusiformis.AAC.1
MQHHEEEAYWIYNGQQDKVPATVRRVKIADNVTKIPDEAFHSHQHLEEVILSSSVQVIGKEAFYWCPKLKSVLYHQSLDGDDGDEEKEEEDAMPSNVKVIERGAFQVIERGAFYGCNLLARLGLKEGLERIEQEAFNGCESLGEVEIPSTVQVIDDYAFYNCRRLARLALKEGRLVRIGKYAFFGCESLTEVDIPSTVIVIDDHAFHGCRRLARLVLKEGQMAVIGYSAFYTCESLTEVDIPSTVKVIDVWAFAYCRRLARLVLKEGRLEQIGKEAFTYCESLTEVYFPSTVKVIYDDAFQGCRRLARLGLNEGLERIGHGAFCECDSLSHVRIAHSVDSIAANAFTKCSSLISIELPEERLFNIDLFGCLSLVSVVGPISVVFPDREHREEFFQKSKLGSLVDDEAGLIHRLKHRFDNSPLNKLCYYQSYHSSDDAMARVHSLMEGGSPLATITEVDEFGMTPLHLLSLSQTPNLDMLLAVMDSGKLGHMVHNWNSLGFTPMDYLCLNRMSNSSEVIRRVLQIRFYQVLGGLDKFWKSAVLQAIDEILAGDWSLRKSEIGRVVRKFERKEIRSLLQLCLWKLKIGEATSKKVKIGEATSKKEQLLADRQRCRVMSGAAVVIPHVLPFLDSN